MARSVSGSSNTQISSEKTYSERLKLVWSNLVACWAHDPEVVGSNPTTNKNINLKNNVI